jgi:SlyX protein
MSGYKTRLQYYLFNLSIKLMHKKIQELESTLAFQEEDIHILNQALIAQQAQIQNLQDKVNLLFKLLQEQSCDNQTEIVNTKPPHY